MILIPSQIEEVTIFGFLLNKLKSSMQINNHSEQLWSKLDRLLVQHAPILFESLQPPATLMAIDYVEGSLGVKFPEEMRTAYLRHDGSNVDCNACFFPPFNQFCSLDAMMTAWQLRQSVALNGDVSEPYANTDSSMLVQPIWWDKKWIPVGISNTMTIITCDLNPGPSGKYGQLLCDSGMGESTPFANGLNNYIENLINRIENKVIGYRDDRWYWTKTGLHILDWNNPDSAY
jgi:cell wall assembly regulator SMI1